jgi:integrase
MVHLKTNGVKKAEKADPIKNKEDLQKLVTYLKATNLRNYTIVVVGVNVLLRAGDLLDLKWQDVLDEDMTFKRKIWITEEKSNKQRKISFNNDSIEALTLYKDSLNVFNINDYIFTSRKVNKNGEKKLDVKALHKIIKDTCKELDIMGNFGTHTLRKTGAYHIYNDNIATNPTVITRLQEILNHSSQAATLRYIGIEAREINEIFDNFKLF